MVADIDEVFWYIPAELNDIFSSLSDDGAYASLRGLEGSTENGHQYKRGSKLNESTSYPLQQNGHI